MATGDLVRMIGLDPRVTPDLRTCLTCVNHEGREEHPALHHVVRDVWQCPRCLRVYVLGVAPSADPSPLRLFRHDDGIWLSLTAPDGRSAAINLSRETRSPIVRSVLARGCRSPT